MIKEFIIYTSLVVLASGTVQRILPRTESQQLPIVEFVNNISSSQVSIEDSVSKDNFKSIHEFLHKMAMIESQDNSSAKNRFGMLGKYQFAPSTIRSVGVHTTKIAFLKDPNLQEIVMIKYMQNNRQELLPYIRKYVGRTVNDIPITESGIIAGAHFAGTTGVIKFLRGLSNKHDANGKSVAFYMKKFSNFDMTKLQEL